jgi:hypothetical protein
MRKDSSRSREGIDRRLIKRPGQRMCEGVLSTMDSIFKRLTGQRGYDRVGTKAGEPMLFQVINVDYGRAQ